MKEYNRRRIATLWIAAASVIALLGCTISGISVGTIDVGETRVVPVAIAREDAEQVRVDIRMVSGELTVDRGAESLLEGQFTFNVDEWEPETSYTVTDGQGRLTIRQPNTDRLNITGNARNEWDLRLSDDVPMELQLQAGAGRHDVDLAGLQITELDMELGAGEADITLGDNPELSRVDVELGAGSVDIDLSGDWAQDVEVEVQGGVGSTTLRLPADVGVRVDVTRGIGAVDTRGLSRSGDVYVNAAYGESEVTLEITVRAGVGQIDLRVQE